MVDEDQHKCHFRLFKGIGLISTVTRWEVVTGWKGGRLEAQKRRWEDWIE